MGASLLSSSAAQSSNSIEAVVGLHFPDSARLDVEIRAKVRSGRVLSEPNAVSRKLSEWENLRIEQFGTPARGKILTRSGSLLATGPKAARIPSRPALAPAASLIDEALDVSLGGKLGGRLLAGADKVLAEIPPTDGQDAATSLDDELQAAAESIFDKAFGALVAVDPRTGGIRALVSNPHREAPDVSPASTPYSPGSTFKIVTAAAALDSGTFQIDDIVSCPAQITAGERQVSNFQNLSYGRISFEKAFAVSCNTAFAQIGMRIGTDRLLRASRKLGLEIGATSGSATISVPRSRGELAVRSYGADGIRISPVRMAEVVATAARGGVRVPVGWTDRPASDTLAMSRSAASRLVRMMEEVVLSGTGERAAVPGAKVAGKTGTADPNQADAARGVRPDAWFVGFAPSRGARLVVVVHLPRGGVGGESAAPIFRDFLIATRKEWN